MIWDWLNDLAPRRITDRQSVQNSKAFRILPFVHLFVSQFGTVVPCCFTPWHEEQVLGNLNRQSIMQIWNGCGAVGTLGCIVKKFSLALRKRSS